MVQRNTQLTIAERAKGAVAWALVTTGTVLVGFYLVARTHSEVMSRMGVRQFSTLQQTHPQRDALDAPKHRVNFDLWSAKRITAYQESLKQHFVPPLAVLEIPRIGLEVPVFDGTDDLTLNRGVGRIIGSARPGKGGNVGIAGHRDGFFRGLKDVEVGDRIELQTPKGTETYQVTSIRITSPKDVQVLEEQGVPALTLVTCYPFYFIGSAPQRYIVRAELSDENLDGKVSVQPNPAIGRSKNQEKTK